MKILRGIQKAIDGERVLSTLPPLGPYITAAAGESPPRRRLSFFTGRALSHLALTDEQRNRMADSARIARGVAPGVVDGFEVALEGTQLVIMPGHAITAEGEDLELHYPLRLSPDAIPVLGSALTGRLAPVAEANAADDALRARITNGEAFTPGKLRGAGRLDLLPHAMVLVAQPLTIANDHTGELDSPCPNAVNEGSFSMLAWEDGFQLVWVPWPADSSSPVWSSDGVTLDERYRNRLAYTVFAREREQGEIADRLRRLRLKRANDRNSTQFAALDAELVLLAARQVDWPWSELGAALALVGFDAAFQANFSDRNSVVRQGGGRKNRAALTPFVGEDVLWRARVAQLLEQVAEQDLDKRGAADFARVFDWLPPAGVLPKDAVDIVANRQLVFPASYEVQAQPVPVDMVDALIAESSPLAPFNLSVRDQVQILVPVPARFFDPDLLKLDVRIHPLFDSEVARLENLRLAVLIQRDRLRRRFDTLSHAITGRLRAYPQDDPDSLPDETGALDAFAFARVHNTTFAAGTTVGHSFRNAEFTLDLAASDELFVFVRLDTKPDGITLQPFVGDAAKKVIFWGSAAAMPADAINAGELPADSGWVRLGIPVATAELSATKLDGLAFGVIGGAAEGEVQWGYAGKTANGQESYWVSDALPQGAVPHDIWEWTEQGEPSPDGAGVVDVANGLSLDTHARVSTELALLTSNYSAYRNGVLKGELGVPGVAADGSAIATPNPRLAGAGLDELIARVDSRIAAANDHVEFGFLRARTDIYRVRQNVLGVGNAGRLLTSPTAAELITRNDNPVATDKDFADYFKRASEAPSVSGNGGPAVTSTVVPSTPGAVTATAATAPMLMATSAPILSALSLNTSSSALSSSVLGTNLRTTKPRVVSSPFRGSISVPVATIESPFGGAAVAVAQPAALATNVPIAALLNVGASPSRLAVTAAPTVKEVTGTSLYGATLNTITVGERLSGSSAVVAKNASVSGKSDFVKTGVGLLADKGFAISDLPVFGYKSKTGAEATVNAASLIDGKLDDSDAEEITGTDVAESVYFKRGLDAIDNMVRFLRGVEIRVEDYKRLQSDATAARTRVLASLSRLEVDLAGLVATLAEVRHDLSVARALRAEELQRVAALIARRKAIIAEHVPYLVFRRPRITRVLLDAPVRTMQPAIIDDPVPRCRADTHDVPAELQAMVDTLKDVPAVWLKKLQPLILKFDRIDKMQALVDTAAQRIVAAPSKQLQMLQNGDQTKTGTLLTKAYQRQADRVMVSAQKQTAALSVVQSDTWKTVATSAAHAISASDLINTGASSRKITLEASGELDDIAGVASCLFNAFCQVPASVRLSWAERFSQLDPDVSLRVLTVLPGFGDERSGVDYIAWKQMQRMVDWLFSRVADEPDAIAAINDLVQVAMLLSAHAPVKRIISARVRKPVKPVLNGRLDLMIDPRIAHIGMQVLVHAPTGNTPIARAVVEDLVADGVVAKIAQVMQPTITIDTNMRVQLQSGPALTTPATARQDAAKAVADMMPPVKSTGDMIAFREAGRSAGIAKRPGK